MSRFKKSYDGSLAAYRAASLNEIRSSKSQIEADTAALKRSEPAQDIESLAKLGALALAQIGTYAPRLEKRLKKLAKRRIKRAEKLRHMQWQHACIDRPVRRPDILNTAIHGMGFVVLEGGLAGLAMAADGHVLPMAAGGYGILFALCNFLVGVAGGYWGLRYCFYKANSPTPEKGDALRRLAGRGGFLASLMAISVLIFSAARTRVTGSHEGIFTFSEVGLAATFNDAFAWILIILGILSSAIAYSKGWAGLADPTPGLSEAHRHAVDDIDRAASKAAESADQSAEGQAENFFDEACPSIEAFDAWRADLTDGFAAINEDRSAHNDRIDELKDDLTARHAEKLTERACVSRKPPKNLHPDLSKFEALKLPPLSERDLLMDVEQLLAINDLKALVTKIEASLSEALSNIDTAIAEFEADSPEIDLYPEDLNEEGA